MTNNHVLADILEFKHLEIEKLKRVFPRDALLKSAEMTGPKRSLRQALLAQDPAIKVIAEIKRSSPMKSFKAIGFDPVQIARSYEAAGAVALSVLTDARFFSGHQVYVPLARESVELPVLRKDFIIDPWQIAETAALGADAVLLMACNFDSTDSLSALYGEAIRLGLEPLIEIHSQTEWEMIKPLKPRLLGVNNRDFNSPDLAIDIQTTARIAPSLPEDAAVISESGLHLREDLLTLLDCNVDGFLVGSSLMNSDDPGAALKNLIGDG